MCIRDRPNTSDVMLSHMREQAEIAIDTADVIIFITDAVSYTHLDVYKRQAYAIRNLALRASKLAIASGLLIIRR